MSGWPDSTSIDLAPGARFFAATQMLRRLWNVEEHPFFRRWAAGALSTGEVAAYAAQCRHTVAALATLTQRAAAQATGALGSELAARAREEAVHADLWRLLSDALSHSNQPEPTPETEHCVAVWLGTENQPLERDLAVLFAVLSTRARLHRGDLTALSAMRTFPGAMAQAFVRRDEQWVEHLRIALERVLTERAIEELIDVVTLALKAQWELLVGIQRICETALAAHQPMRTRDHRVRAA